MITLGFVSEFNIDRSTSEAINELLQSCFPEIDYKGADYFKQLPHYRIIAKENDTIIGQLGIDFRAMNLNGEAIHVFGVVALCVAAAHRGKKVGVKMLQEFERIAQQNAQKIDYLFLVTDTPSYYEKLGYTTTAIETTWLKVHEHKNYGLATEKINDAAFMFKAISDKKWQDGQLDLLGHMY